MSIKYERKTEVAKEICVKVNKPTDEYALDLLHIFNNAREYPTLILKLWNNSGNDIFILTPAHHVEEAKEYLEQFGEIVWIEDRVVHKLQPIYDNAGWKELYEKDDEAIWLIDEE